MLAKFIAYFFTNSNAILTDAAESIVNVLASSFAFYSIYLSSRPKDKNHPYGHGKVEFFSAFVEGILISIAGLIIIVKSIYDLFHPHFIQQILVGAMVILFTGIINGGLGFYMVKKSKYLSSISIYAEGKHLISDAISSIGLVAGLIIIYLTNIYWLDSIFSILLGLFIIYSGYKLTRKSVGGLMDESDIEIVKDVIKILQVHRKNPWIDVHNLRTQRYGASIHIDCHVTLPYYYDLNEVHAQVSDIHKVINEHTSVDTELFIHADPCLFACCFYCNMKNCEVRKELKSADISWDIENVTKNQKHFEIEKEF